MSAETTFTAPLTHTDAKLWPYYVPVPAPVVAAFHGAGIRRFVVTLNDAVEHQCAFTPIGGGVYVVVLNQKIRTKLNLHPGALVQVSVRPDESTYGLPMPEEFQAVLDEDEEGNRLLHALPPGKRRTLLYIVGQGRDTDARIRRALVIVEHLKARKGKLNYPELGEELKRREE